MAPKIFYFAPYTRKPTSHELNERLACLNFYQLCHSVVSPATESIAFLCLSTLSFSRATKIQRVSVPFDDQHAVWITILFGWRERRSRRSGGSEEAF